MAPLPCSATLSMDSKPLLMNGAQAALSPTLGAPATPAVWQAVQTAWKTCSPVLKTLGALASTSSNPATGAMRRATASSVSVSEPAPTFVPELTMFTSMMMTMIGTRKASTTVTISCLGVLMGEACSSLCSCSLLITKSCKSGTGAPGGGNRRITTAQGSAPKVAPPRMQTMDYITACKTGMTVVI